MGSKTQHHAISKPMQYSLCLLVLVLGLSSAWLGARLLLANMHQYRASSFLSDWEQKRQVPSDKAWQVAEDAMTQAIAWYPSANAAYAEQLGYMWQWRGYSANTAPAEKQSSQQNALQAFRQATSVRPSWPYAWSGLAYAKMIAGEYDQEFQQALQQAVHYGPTRIGINRRIAEIGLISWPQLDAEQRALVLEQASRTARYGRANRTQMFNVAADVGRVELLCEHLQDGFKPCAPIVETPRTPANSTFAE